MNQTLIRVIFIVVALIALAVLLGFVFKTLY